MITCTVSGCTNVLRSYNNSGYCRKHQQFSLNLLALRETNVQKVAKIKLEAGCMDCGYKLNSISIDFDHVRGEKYMAIGMMYGLPWQRIEEEISKCEVVCANCHRIRTYQRQMAEIVWSESKIAVKCRSRRQLLFDIKKGTGCADCGYDSHPEALEFDHVRGTKAFQISSCLTRNWEAILAEIDKCDVVCVMCHRVRTSDRLAVPRAS